MPTARDLAAFIIRSLGPMSSMKLQKLCYYTQAYSLAWFNERVFDEPIEAWTNGPVVRDLWKANKGQFTVYEVPGGNADAVVGRDAKVAGAVLDSMGGLSGKQLSDRTHAEDPWRDNYDGDDEYPNTPIPLEEMRAYYARHSAS